MNNLFTHGITTELSDLRIHVSPISGYVYMFTQECMRAAIAQGNFPQAPTYVNGKQSALGWLVPTDAVEKYGWINKGRFKNLQERFGYRDNMSTSEKGRVAVAAVKWLVEHEKMPLGINTFQEVNIKPLQILGVDAVLGWKDRRATIWAEIKLDAKAAPGRNLYIQSHEKNEFKQY